MLPRRVWLTIIWPKPAAWAPTGDGMAKFVKMLPAILSKVADAAGALPRVLATDRGSCFYHGATGHLVKAYAKAVTHEGFHTLTGDDASSPPPDIPDVLVHETVVAWFQKRQTLSLCTTDKTHRPLTESVDYSVLSPCTNEALATTNESRDKAKPGRASEIRQAEPSRATQSQAEPGAAFWWPLVAIAAQVPHDARPVVW